MHSIAIYFSGVDKTTGRGRSPYFMYFRLLELGVLGPSRITPYLIRAYTHSYLEYGVQGVGIHPLPVKYSGDK
jgi:hypothetical protein